MKTYESMDPVGKETKTLTMTVIMIRQISIFQTDVKAIGKGYCEETWSCEGRFFCVED